MRLSSPGFSIRCGGYTRFELVVRVLVGAILAATLLERMLYYQELAEHAVMEATIIHIRSGMRLHVADLMTQQRNGEIGAMLNENPVRWLQHPPEGYAGALEREPAGGMPGGSWYFDSGRGELVYVPKLARFFSGAQGKREARFRVTARTIGTVQKEGQPRQVEGVDIVPVQSYKWF